MSEPYGQPPSPNWQPSPVPSPGTPGPGPAPYGTQPPPPGVPGPGMAGPAGPQAPYGQPGAQAPYGQPGAQAPYGQPGAQAPYGQPGGQAPYGQPGGQAPYPPAGPYPPSPYGAPSPYGPPGGPDAARRRKRALIVLPLALVVLIGIIVAGRLSSHSEDAAVGDCVHRVTSGATQSKDDSIKIVKCTDPAATYKVVGKVEHISKLSLNIRENLPSDGGKGICGQFPSATVRFWKGTSKDGYVLCLAPNQH
ncbi:LppU/SCO3897 family protein [Actinoallomurus rhizosphaericola]|uniref:LppU/SCO3897 family protein n=1 Tax=Actinoallomurus rhizosphaericola TaxID=2952536 RepID=UPI0020925E1C|nr:hypothetical protein [Actinoallomurus rhizosphaericola]MCO5996075.1 hypothetical protein [Actinoallomurus rhizosphaericola]